ncbi:farnesol dehydrogenase-like [Condylostylus longicornis]|uniref:farnesol dehydrogenase-like n=1 Tax=Condylostylus longicornis TaxID=2530218 RepID=UPI00244E3AE8|nr:farnesol dehydrogenase-like [Condylostylus longicornis]
MERWVEKVAVVTGATSGIGSAIVVELVKAGMIVCGLSRRKDKVEQLRCSIIGAPGQLNAVECDITSEQSVTAAFNWIIKTFGGVDVLINNAGVTSKYLLLEDNNIKDFRTMLETNLIGLIICTKQALKLMKEREVQGVIVNINSILGHKINTCVPGTKPVNGMYPACKYALTALTECLRQEIMYFEMNAKVMNISPGLVQNDILSTGGDNDLVKLMPTLDPVEVARAVMFAMCTPENVLVQDLVIKPGGEFL